MKKIFRYIGITTLVIISFCMTEKTTTVLKETDEIMKQINENKKKYEQQPILAQQKDNTIIPGLNGKKVNVNKSYEEMKKIGKYNEKYYVYDQIEPNISIKNIYNKYIQNGNKQKNMITLIIKVEQNENIDDILNIIEKEKIKVTFYLDNEWIKQNKKLTHKLLKQQYTLINDRYCYTEEENDIMLKKCNREKQHTIKPYVIENELLTQTKKIITNGIIISLPINDNIKKELELTIKYIKKKGYNIVNLEELLSEKNTN